MKKLVLVGASTGGPGHLKELFSSLPSNLEAPIIVAQHMGEMFLPSFIEQFDSELAPDVKGITNQCLLNENCIYICEKNIYLSHSIDLTAHVDPSSLAYNPCIDLLFDSSAKIADKYEILAILLTGIGQDGAYGLLHLHERGASCIAESEESAIVYGMPKKAKELNPDVKVLHLKDIKKELERFLNVFL